MQEGSIVKLINWTDSMIKFPNLKKGEIGIQVGFDLSSKNLTTDVIKMNYRTTNIGQVIAIDPDPFNHERLQPVIEQRGLNIKLIQKATYSHQTTDKLSMGHRSSHNKINSVQSENSSVLTDKVIEVELDTLDHIVEELGLDYDKIRHISITNNGAEYETLLGMENILEKCEHINLTIASGRPDKMGEVNNKRDYEMVTELLTKKGFTCKLLRINQSFWWGVIHNLLFKGRWLFNKKTFGVVMASRGERKIKFYQSFS